MKVYRRFVQGVTILAVEGRMDLEHHEELMEAYRRLLPDERLRLIIDLSRVSVLSSTGCCALVNFRSDVENRGGALVLAPLSKTCLDVLRLLNLHRRFSIASSHARALALLEDLSAVC